MAKRKRPWKCLACGAAMCRGAAEVAARVAEDYQASGVWHVCGACKEVHSETPRGRLRLLTPGELFQLEVENGDTLDAIRRTEFAPSDGAATLYLVGPDRSDQ